MIANSKLEMKPVGEIKGKRGLSGNGAVQKFIDSEVLRLSSPYVPFRSGVLEGSGTRHTSLGSGRVIWKTPYARRLYYNPQFNYAGAPQRGGQWFERMKVQHKREILSGAAKIAGGRSE